MALTLALLAWPVAAQETDPGQSAGPEFTDADGAELRFLDKLTSETGDVTLGKGQSAKFGRLVVRLDTCRYPTGNPASDHPVRAVQWLDAGVFSRTLSAGSPALRRLGAVLHLA
jgi:hypothetical protein